MKIFSAPKRLLTLLFLSLLAVPAVAHAQTHLVISQVYGGGGGGTTTTTYTYNTDYVELYNPTADPISLVGLSLQYGSAAGNFGTSAGNVKAFTTGTVQPGKYYLVTGGSGSQGGTIPVAADDTSGLSISATSGKVALVNGTTSISSLGSSTSCTNAAVIDEVSFGATSCAEGTSAAAPSSTTAVIRTDPTTDSNNNATDFAVGTPCPRNSTISTCPMPTMSLAVTAATSSPSSILAGSSTLLSVTVTPGTTSTGIAVTADLSSVGGSATQAFTISSTANVYTYTLNVGGSVGANSYTLPVTVRDQQSGSASGSIALTVTPTVSATPISTLQANRSTYTGTTVSATGVVTSVIYNGFFLQMPNSAPASRATGVSEAIDVFTSSAPTVHVGDNVTVTGSLTLFPAATASVTPALEISKPTITTNSTGNALPPAIVLTSADLTPTGGLQQLTRYESMRVQMSLTATSGTGESSLDEPNETYTSNGYFYAVMTGTPRPFRESGVDVRDAGASALPVTVARFDDNPERIYVGTTLMNAAPLDVSTGAIFNNVTGILDFTYSNDSFYDPSRFIPDAGSLTSSYTPGLTPTPANLPTAGQATVAAFNIERFYNTRSADDLDYYPVTGKVETSEAVDVTQAAYNRRLTKVSLAIRHMLNNPDIVAIEEAENGTVLADIAAQISADATTAGEPDPKYVAHGTDNSTFYSNDFSGISTGFLVKSTTTDFIGLDQYFNKSTFTPTAGTKQVLTTTDDRPPFVLHAGIQRGAGVKDYPITVIVNHLKALPDSDQSVSQKKELQVEELAGLIQGYQAKGEHVLAVGDFNAFEFNDGYGDYLGTATNTTVPASQVVTPGKAGLVTPAPKDLALNLPANQRYSYVEDGSAQILDHVIASADIATSTTLSYVHFDADFPNTLYNDATTPARTSDHDPALAYLTIPAPVAGATLLPGTVTFASATLGTSSDGQVITLTNSGETAISFTGATITGDFSQSNNCGTSLAVGATCAFNVVFKPTAAGTRTGTLTVASSATVSPATLTGTGVVVVPDFTLDGSATGKTSLTVAAGTSGTVAIKLASVGGFAGTFTFTCATSGTAATGAGCSVTSPVTLTANGTATATVTITTTARTQASGLGAMPRKGRAAYILLVMLLSGAAFTMRKAGRNVRIGGLLVLLFAVAAGLSGCSSSSLNTSSNPNGTPNGVFNYTVTATSGSIVHTENVAVTIQ